MYYMGAYEGRSPMSWVIRKATRHWCSHVSMIREDGACVEAWHKGGVRVRDHFNQGHTPETPIHLYELYGMLPEQLEGMWSWMCSQEGKGYDMPAIWAFGHRGNRHNPDKWICSELFCEAAERETYPLQNCPTHKLAPAWCVRSVRVRYYGTVFTGHAPSSASISQQTVLAKPAAA